MFLKYIRDDIIWMPFIALSSSMKSSLSDFFFHIEFFALFNSLLLKHVYLFTVLFELSLRHVTEHVTKRMTTIRSKFRSTLGNKKSVENNIISHFWFCLPSRKTISKQVFGNRMIDWQNYEFDYVRLSLAIEPLLFELVGFPNVRLDISCILLHCSTSGDAM